MNPFRLPRWRFTNCCGHDWGHAPTLQDTSQLTGTSRRDFFKTAAASVAGLAAITALKEPALAQVRVFPPPPPSVSPVEGLIDFHTHCAPDVFGRAVDDDESAQAYRERKIEAEVLKVCAQQKLVVCTGHASPAEALAIVEAARDAGCDRIVITHAEFEVVNMSVEQMKKAASMGAKMEICAMGPLMGPNAHLAWMRHWRQVTYQESAGHVKAIGAENFLLSTDLGQTGNPSQPDGYAMLVTGLMGQGITKEQIRTMGRETPGKLLMG